MLRVAENFQKSNLTVRKRGMAGSCQFRLRLSTDGRPADILAPSPPLFSEGVGGSEGEFSPLCTFVSFHVDCLHIQACIVLYC